MIYLDNAATTKPSQAAIEAFLKTTENFANPSSLHRLGLDAEKILKNARKTIADTVGCKSENIYFTSGGTEANNLAVLGTAKRTKRRHIITSKIEHPSVLEPIARLEGEGFRVDRIGVDREGRIDLCELSDKLSEDTALVSIMQVNNETGTIQPTAQIRRLIDEKAKGALYHIDAVQGFCKVPASLKETKADFMSISSHKVNGFKGTGALYIKDINKLMPILMGGGQQNGVRSGTENVGGIAAFAAASKEHNNEAEKVSNLRKRLLDGIMSAIPDVKYNGADDNFSPYILNVSFLGIKAEILLHALESEGIYVSTGSACSSHKPMPSHVLTAMGCTREEISGAVRFSFDTAIEEEDVIKAIDVISDKVSEIRKYMR